MRPSQGKSTIWSMKPHVLAKAPTQRLATFTITLQTTVLERYAHIFMQTIVPKNKNNFFMWFFARRVITELHQNITYSFLIAGHTKFVPDRCFGTIKKCYKVNFISSIYELAVMVETLSDIGVNKAQQVGTHDNRIIVPVYDWASFLAWYFNRLPNIKKYHHFCFLKDELGKIYFKESSSSRGQSFMLLTDPSIVPQQGILPSQIKPEGLSVERKRYLFNEIRQFCKSGTEDLVAPAPVWKTVFFLVNRTRQCRQCKFSFTNLYRR